MAWFSLGVLVRCEPISTASDLILWRTFGLYVVCCVCLRTCCCSCRLSVKPLWHFGGRISFLLWYFPYVLPLWIVLCSRIRRVSGALARSAVRKRGGFSLFHGSFANRARFSLFLCLLQSSGAISWFFYDAFYFLFLVLDGFCRLVVIKDLSIGHGVLRLLTTLLR